MLIRRRIEHVLAIALISSVNIGAHAASFDCQSAKSVVDRQICADPALSILDETLGKAYNAALASSADPEVLKEEQKRWLRQRNLCLKSAEDSACEFRSISPNEIYETRIAALKLAAVHGPTQCDEGSATDVGSCLSRMLAAKENELAFFIDKMKSDFIDPDAELVAQVSWREYMDKECMSRVTLAGSSGGAQNIECRLNFIQNRLKELEDHHSCREDDRFCPLKK